MRSKSSNSFKSNLAKPGESISFKRGLVIKHFDDEQIVKDRVERARILDGLVPKIIQSSTHSYAYKFVDGELLSKTNDVEEFKQFLDFCDQRLWKRKKLSPKEKKVFLEKTKRFYLDKTNRRLEKFYRETDIKDRAVSVNGIRIPKLSSLLDKIDWDDLSRGIPALFHGDLQPENILVTKSGLPHRRVNFKLLDWRHDFEGLKEYGDLYYDLAKLYHALIVSNEVIRNGQYGIDIVGERVSLQFLLKSNLLVFKDILDDFIEERGYDLKRVRILSALIYLNIAPLYDSPYNKFLYYLGIERLHHDI